MHAVNASNITETNTTLLTLDKIAHITSDLKIILSIIAISVTV